jgi:hypothetical protein
MIDLSQVVVNKTASPFDLFKKNGYYLVGNKAFNYKVRALQEATRTGEFVRWIFNDDAFTAMNWKQPLGISMNEMYRRRAQQLRDQYDYLVLFFSGGADSTVILQSFVNYGIHLDEVVVAWPITQTEGRYTPNAQDFSPRNLLSEWQYAIKPKLDWLAQNHPRVKITICDVLDDPENNHFSEDTVTFVDNHSYIGVNRNLQLDRILRDRTEQYPSCAGLFGVAPIECAILDNQYLCAYFMDSATNGVMKSDCHSFTQYQRNIEFFYWTPDMPEIVREQGHALLNYLNVDTDSRRYIPHITFKNQRVEFTNRPDPETRRSFKKPIIYPSWQECFQVDKPEDQIGFSSWQSWWHENSHSHEYITSWESAVRSEISMIDIKFFKLRSEAKSEQDLLKDSLVHQPTGEAVVLHRPIISKFYSIGRLNPVDQ